MKIDSYRAELRKLEDEKRLLEKEIEGVEKNRKGLLDKLNKLIADCKTKKQVVDDFAVEFAVCYV